MMHVRTGPMLHNWWVGWLDLNSSLYVVGEEVGSQNLGLHYHTIFKVDVKKDAVRKAINAELSRMGLKGERGKENKYYGGLKEWDENIAYACKEGKIVASAGYTPEQLEAATIQGKESYRNSPSISVHNTKEQKKQQIKNHVEELVNKCVEHCKQNSDLNNYYSVLKCATNYYLESYKGRIDDYRLIPLVRSALYQVGGISKYAMQEKAYDNIVHKLAPYRPGLINMSESGQDLISHD